MLLHYLRRGLEAGLLAGLAFGLFVALVGNPLIGVTQAMAEEPHVDGHEETAHADGGHAEGDEAATDDHETVVSRTTTRLVSVTGGIGWGLLAGVVFGVAFYVLEPVLPGAADTQSYALAAAGFLTVSGIPWLVVPPQPAGVEGALPTSTGILVYGGMVVLGATLCAGSLFVFDRLADRYSRPLAAVCALAPFTLLAVPIVLAPGSGGADALTAELTASYRGFVLFGQLGLWAVLGSAHGWLLRRDRDATTDQPTQFSSPTAQPPFAD